MKKFSFGARGWLLVIWAFLCIAMASAIPSTVHVAVGLFAQKGFNSTLLLSLMTYGSWGTLVCLFILNFFTAKGKVSYRKLGLVIGILWAVFTALWGFVGAEWLFVVVYILSFLCCQLMVLVVVNNTIANWFPTRKGTVIGLATMGFMLGAMAGVKLFGPMVVSLGNLGLVYVAFGAVIAIIVLFGFFALRDYPEECGCYPDNNREMTREQADAMFKAQMEEAAKSPWTQGRVLGTWQVWFISIACGIMLLFSSVLSSQLMVRLVAAGYEMNTAVNMFMACCLIGCVGSWFIGWVDNRIGPKAAAIITMIAMIVACVLTTLKSTPLMWIALALLGVELGGSSNFTTSLVVTYWGRQSFGKVYGVVVIIQQVIGAFGALFASTTSAKWNYDVTYLIMAGMSVVAIILLIPLKKGFAEKKEAAWGVTPHTGNEIPPSSMEE